MKKGRNLFENTKSSHNPGARYIKGPFEGLCYNTAYGEADNRGGCPHRGPLLE